MNYKSVLNSFEAVEEGDFMRYYETVSFSFVIYSPVEDSVSCMELSTFRDITAFELAVRLHLSVDSIVGTKEFKFDVVCSKSDLIKYFFDIEQIEDDSVISRVSYNEGVLLHDISNVRKVRNVFLFNPVTKEARLQFKNELCLASFNVELEKADIVLCWNPYLYSTLKVKLNDSTVYLLPCTSYFLSGHICKMLENRSCGLALYVSEEVVNQALIFLSHYIQYFGLQDKFNVSSENGNISILLNDWKPERVMNLLSKAQKYCNEQMKTLYNANEDERKINISIYQCQVFKNDTAIDYPDNTYFTFSLFQFLVKEINLSDSVLFHFL
jgi:hypothetical protein